LNIALFNKNSKSRQKPGMKRKAKPQRKRDTRLLVKKKKIAMRVKESG